MSDQTPERALRAGNRLMDRPEYKDKQVPLTAATEMTDFESVSKMSDKNYGSVIVIDGAAKVVGVVTERDVMNKLVAKNLDASKTPLSDIMTTNPRLARETIGVASCQTYGSAACRSVMTMGGSRRCARKVTSSRIHGPI